MDDKILGCPDLGNLHFNLHFQHFQHFQPQPFIFSIPTIPISPAARGYRRQRPHAPSGIDSAYLHSASSRKEVLRRKKRGRVFKRNLTWQWNIYIYNVYVYIYNTYIYIHLQMDFPILPPWTPDFEASAWKPWNLQPIALLQHVAYPNSEAKVQTWLKNWAKTHSVHCLIIFTYYLTVEELVPRFLVQVSTDHAGELHWPIFTSFAGLCIQPWSLAR